MRERGFFWIGLLLGGGLTAAAFETPYLNWQSAAAPVDEQPLIVRQDAKGDGHFLSPRSGRRFHRGIDVVAPLNSPVRAIRSGRVIEVGTHRGLGRFVELEHAHQLRSRYAHLNTISVEVGARVRQGAMLGTVGKTGNARHPWITPHLHLEVLRNGAPIDPQTLGLAVVNPEPRAESRQARATAPIDSSGRVGVGQRLEFDASGGE